jgi:predicted Zn-dependent protease
MRRLGLMLLVAGLVVGCESVRPAPVRGPVPPPAHSPTPLTTPAPVARGRAPKPPIEVLRASATQPAPPLRQEPAEDDALALAAKCLQRDDHRGAAVHLDTYVRAHPDQPLFRLRLAELYLRGDRPADAKFHYERFVADAQSGPALRPYLVPAHTKLMEIAQRADDRFGELFHRGVGLLLLVKEQDGAKDRDEVFCEEMLCKALRALLDAKELKPSDPRVRVYLAEVQERTGNRRAANAERAAARTGVVGGGLTPTERRPLLLGE